MSGLALSNDDILQHYQRIIEAGGYVIFTASKEGLLTYVSQSAEKLTGYRPDELLGKSFTELVRPDWHERVRQHYRQESEQRETHTALEFPILTRSGERRWVEQSVFILNEADDNHHYQAIIRDVTEHHLQAVRHQSLFDATFEMIALHDGKTILEVNPAFENVLGYDRQEIIGAPLDTILAQSVEAQVGHAFETLVRHKDGSTFPAYVRTKSIQYKDRVVTAMSFYDISKRKQAEQQLLENEQRFRGLFDHNNDAVFFISLDGIIENVNQRATELFGYTTEELVGKHAQENISPEERTEGDTLRRRLLDGENVPIYQRTFIHKDGTPIPVEINNALVRDSEGKPSHIQSIVRDVSERNRTQSELADRVNQLTTLREVDAELADRLDVDYVLTMAVDSVVRLTGADIGFIALIDEENTMQQTRIVGDYSVEQIETHYQQQTGIMGRVIHNMQAELVTDVSQDADYIAVNSRTQSQLTVPLISQERLIGILNLETSKPERFNEDTFDLVKLITTRIAAAIDNAYLYKQSEAQLEQLRELYAKVSNLEQLKTDMIRIASHDLRNPLASLSGFIELMQMDLPDVPTPDQLEDQLKNMSQSTSRMNKIIRDILSLERIEQAANEADYQVFSLSGLVEQIVDEHRPQANMMQQQFTLTIEEDEDEPLLVKGQEAEIREAAANLITNALKYTPEGGKIDVVLKSDRGKLSFTITDNGYGIKEDQQANLFQPFYRARSAETAKIEGTGLGLHLVKKIIERHHGKMIFESVYGQGSTFGFTLPWAMP